MNFEEDTISVAGLEKFAKALKAKPPRTRVGILGEGGARSTNDKNTKHAPTNAEIGAVHEFGSPARSIQQRSFLRIPIADKLNTEMQKSGLLDYDTLAKILKEGSITPWMEIVAVLAEDIVLGAFDSGGYGKWPSWKDPNYSNNANQLLVDTKQLRDSITHEVKA